MEKVRAKFKCESVTEPEAGKKSVKLRPVYGNGDPNHENTKFFNLTPWGSVELGTVNEEAAKMFVPGKEYYLDFTPAE